MKQMREERERRGERKGRSGRERVSAQSSALFLFTGASKRDQITASLVEAAGMVQSGARRRARRLLGEPDRGEQDRTRTRRGSREVGAYLSEEGSVTCYRTIRTPPLIFSVCVIFARETLWKLNFTGDAAFKN